MPNKVGLMKKKSVKNKEIKIKGILIPEAWDEKGRVVAAHIAARGEKKIELDCRSKMGKELLKHLQQEIEVTGLMSQGRYAPAKMKVIAYELLINTNTKHLEKKLEKLWKTNSPFPENSKF